MWLSIALEPWARSIWLPSPTTLRARQAIDRLFGRVLDVGPVGDSPAPEFSGSIEVVLVRDELDLYMAELLLDDTYVKICPHADLHRLGLLSTSFRIFTNLGLMKRQVCAVDWTGELAALIAFSADLSIRHIIDFLAEDEFGTIDPTRLKNAAGGLGYHFSSLFSAFSIPECVCLLLLIGLDPVICNKALRRRYALDHPVWRDIGSWMQGHPYLIGEWDASNIPDLVKQNKAAPSPPVRSLSELHAVFRTGLASSFIAEEQKVRIRALLSRRLARPT